MQATAVVETASNKGHNNNGRNIQKGKRRYLWLALLNSFLLGVAVC